MTTRVPITLAVPSNAPTDPIGVAGAFTWLVTQLQNWIRLVANVLNNLAGQLPATATNDNAAPGNVGEYVSAQVLFASALSTTSGTPQNLTSITLTAGDWDLRGNVYFFANGAGAPPGPYWGGINTTSATLPDKSLVSVCAADGTVAADQGVTVPGYRISLAVSATVYLVAQATWSTGGPVKIAGFLQARRAR